MSGNTSETRCKHCGEPIFKPASYWLHEVDHRRFCKGSINLAEPTPPEGEAVTEQRETPKYWQCPNNEAHPLKFGEKIYGTSTYRMYCLDCPNTVAVFRSKPIPAPVVSTAAPEPPPKYHQQNHAGFAAHVTRLGEGVWDKNCPDCKAALDRAARPSEPSTTGRKQILDGLAKTEHAEGLYDREPPVAPESYKPGPELSELIAQQGIKPMKTGHELEIPGLSDEDMEGFPGSAPAATPVTVEAPETQVQEAKEHFEQWWIKGNPHSDTARYATVLLNALQAATPKPIGDVEAVARTAVEFLLPETLDTRQDYIELLANKLTPFFAPAGPEVVLSQGNASGCTAATTWAIGSTLPEVPAQPPCSECATLQKQIAKLREWNNTTAECAAQQNIEKQAVEAECATLRKERDDLLAMFCERHIDTTLSDANVNDDCPLCITESSAEADEAQLSTLRDELRKYGNHVNCDYHHFNPPKPCNCGFEAALAPTPEVAPKEGKS